MNNPLNIIGRSSWQRAKVSSFFEPCIWHEPTKYVSTLAFSPWTRDQPENSVTRSLNDCPVYPVEDIHPSRCDLTIWGSGVVGKSQETSSKASLGDRRRARSHSLWSAIDYGIRLVSVQGLFHIDPHWRLGFHRGFVSSRTLQVWTRHRHNRSGVSRNGLSSLECNSGFADMEQQKSAAEKVVFSFSLIERHRASRSPNEIKCRPSTCKYEDIICTALRGSTSFLRSSAYGPLISHSASENHITSSISTAVR